MPTASTPWSTWWTRRAWPGFYLYSRTEGVLSPYLPLAYGGATYIYTGIPSEKASVPGLKAATVEAFSQTLSGWRYEDAALSDFVVLYLMDDGGQYGYYTYDSKNATLQRFSGAVFTDSGETLAVPCCMCTSPAAQRRCC